MVEEELSQQFDSEVPSGVLRAWGWVNPKLTHIQIGHINQTFRVRVSGHESEYVLQRLNPIFGPAVHYDIEAVTDWLHLQGMLTPRLVRTETNGLWFIDDDGSLWRALTWIEGDNFSLEQTAELVYQAGKLVATFHRALMGFKYKFRNQRVGVHDTPKHVNKLNHVLESHDYHSLHSEVSILATEALGRINCLPPLDSLPCRVTHGDLKLNNILFDSKRNGLCLIDLDTLGEMSISLELGDALRSWCNPTGETQAASEFSLEHYEASLLGYLAGGGDFLKGVEIESIPNAVELISLELAIRFLRDALEESYFAWDKSNFASAGAQNLLRAKSQLSLARAFADKKDQATKITKQVFRIS